MSDGPVRARGGSRHSLTFALVLCATWLVVQNAVLLVLAPWPGAQAVQSVVRVLVRAAWVVVQPLWPVAVCTVMVLGVAAWLAVGAVRAPRREVGRARSRS